MTRRPRLVSTAVVTSLFFALSFAPVALAEDAVAPSAAPTEATPSISSAPTESASASPSPSAIEGPTQGATEVPADSPTASPSRDASPSAEPTPSSTPTPDASAAAVTPATLDPTYEFPDNSLCPGDDKLSWVDYVSGAITIDLSSLTDRTAITINGSANENCRADITSLSFTHRPDSLTSIRIGEEAFLQARDGVANALTSVRFPDGITDLWISPGAFAQQSDVGSNTLSEVVFPESLEMLLVDAHAFEQLATGDTGDNALTSVTLHTKVGHLTTATSAFHQYSASGNNTLASLTYDLSPGATDANLMVNDYAFAQEAPHGHNALRAVHFPGGYDSVQVGEGGFQQSAGGNNTLASLTYDSSTTSVLVGAGAFAQTSTGGHNALTEVHFPETLVDGIDVDEGAFRQTVSGTGVSTALREVTFPSHTVYVMIYDNAFAQVADDGNCTLATITFPESLDLGLGIGAGSFAQQASGRTALSTLRFPEVSPMLVVYDRAFFQSGTTTLTTVTFPTTVQALLIGPGAFAQEGSLALARIVLPFSAEPTGGTLFSAEVVAGDANVDWQWFGPDGADIGNWKQLEVTGVRSLSTRQRRMFAPANVTAHSVAGSQLLTGYRTLTLSNLSAADTTSYVYRDGTTVTAPLAGQSTVIGSGSWRVPLTTPKWTGKTFAGWCSSEPAEDGSCAGTLTAAGTRYPIGTDTTLWATWAVADTDTDTDELAATGTSSTTPLTLLAIVMIGIGVALLRVRRTV